MTTPIPAKPISIRVRGRLDMRRLLMKVPFIVISIRDPDTDPVRFPGSQLCRGVLSLKFHDTEPTPNFQLPASKVLMAESDAAAIASFVRKHASAVEAIVVHCEAGMSRSPAVAAAIARYLNIDHSRFFLKYLPNVFVYRLTCNAFGIDPNVWPARPNR